MSPIYSVFFPNTKLVATTFTRLVYNEIYYPTPLTNFGVGGTLPENTSTWSEGFIQLTVVGGSPDIDVPTRRPLIQVDCWVPSINSSKPQWGRASSLAEDLVQYIYAHGENMTTELTLGSYKNARVQSVYVASEPREVHNDPAGHARVTFDIVLIWTMP